MRDLLENFATPRTIGGYTYIYTWTYVYVQNIHSECNYVYYLIVIYFVNDAGNMYTRNM